jgi:hypothetical protein
MVWFSRPANGIISGLRSWGNWRDVGLWPLDVLFLLCFCCIIVVVCHLKYLICFYIIFRSIITLELLIGNLLQTNSLKNLPNKIHVDLQ